MRPTRGCACKLQPHIWRSNQAPPSASYKVLSAIGAGGMGEVYKARGTKLDRDVALQEDKSRD